MDKQYQRLGEWLVGHGKITREQLVETLELVKCSKSGKRLGDTLIGLGFLKEEHLVACLAEQYSYPIANLTRAKPAAVALATISWEIARKKTVLPLSLEHDILTCVVADPLNLEFIDELARSTKAEVKLQLAPSMQIRKAIEKAYSELAAKAAGRTPQKHVGKLDPQEDRKAILNEMFEPHNPSNSHAELGEAA